MILPPRHWHQPSPVRGGTLRRPPQTKPKPTLLKPRTQASESTSPTTCAAQQYRFQISRSLESRHSQVSGNQCDPRVFLHGPSVGGQRTSQDRFGRRSEGRSRQLFQLKLDFCVQLRDRPNNYGYSDRHRRIPASQNRSSCDKNCFQRKCIDPVSDRLEYRQPQSDDCPVHFYFGARDPTERQHT